MTSLSNFREERGDPLAFDRVFADWKVSYVGPSGNVPRVLTYECLAVSEYDGDDDQQFLHKSIPAMRETMGQFRAPHTHGSSLRNVRDWSRTNKAL